MTDVQIVIESRRVAERHNRRPNERQQREIVHLARDLMAAGVSVSQAIDDAVRIVLGIVEEAPWRCA